MATSRLLAGASGYSFKEWKGNFLSGEDQGRRRCSPGMPSACRRSRSTTRSTGCPRPTVLENWAGTTPEGFRFAIKASRRITHIARIKAETAAEPLDYLYQNLAALGAKRGPVLFQLPPNLKKDLPRLAAFLEPAPGGPRRRVRIPQRHLVRRRRLRRARRRAGAALCLSEREDNAPPPLVETAPWGYVRLRLENVLG